MYLFYNITYNNNSFSFNQFLKNYPLPALKAVAVMRGSYPTTNTPVYGVISFSQTVCSFIFTNLVYAMFVNFIVILYSYKGYFASVDDFCEH